MLNRRDWIRMIAGGGASLLGPARPAGAPKLAPYVDRLPVPPIRRPSPQPDALAIVRMRECAQKAHRDLPPTRLWGYDAMWPGPTFEVRTGQRVRVKWINELPTKHFLPIDRTIHGADALAPEVRTVVHVHGARTWPDSDGYPEAWSTSDGHAGPYFSPEPSRYPNDQPAATLWYHDHAIGITRLNIYAGLSGLYLIRDDQEDALNLPRGRFEIPLIIQDRTFNADGSLQYPTAEDGTHPVWVQEFFGDTSCVNGKVTPFLEVEPRRYRFRLLNASNSRVYHLKLSRADAPPFQQIGTDNGLLPRPLTLRRLLVSPGERLDLIIDFSGFGRASLDLVNDAPAPYPSGQGMVPAEVMRFTVTRPLSRGDTSALPGTLIPFAALDATQAVRERILAVTEIVRPADGYTVMGLLGQRHWDDAITEDPVAGATEIWSFANTTGDVHPIHVHLVRFQVLNRQPFDVRGYLETGRLVLTGNPLPPESNERPAWKDTVKAYPGYVTRVIQRFELPAGASVRSGDAFRYVWHCHMLEHEDNEMMRPYHVVG
jgi:spore coat protein A